MPNANLPEIPVVDVGRDFPIATLDAEHDRAIALLREASGRIPGFAVRTADAISRRWLKRWHPSRLAEIDRIAERLGRPGAYFLNVSYEWGCTSAARSAPDDGPAQLARVLDWPDNGLGRHVIAARVENLLGAWITLTWPGYSGVLQASAPGRFAAALNQGPMDQRFGNYAFDWMHNRRQVWKTPHLPPAHLLRQAFEEAATYAQAKRLLIETPVALPVIFTLAGLASDDGCVIERIPQDAHVIETPAAAANHWQCGHWSGRARGDANPERQAQMAGQSTLAPEKADRTFPWLTAPVLNKHTRLAMVAEPATGRLWAQGYEATGPATAMLRIGPTDAPADDLCPHEPAGEPGLSLSTGTE